MRSKSAGCCDQVLNHDGALCCSLKSVLYAGGFFRRGISGGERKRVSVGHELLINPAVLMLDEPTSGLDSTTAMHLVETLRKLAEGGRAIITTIHQPSSRLYTMLDKLLLLSEGHAMFYGMPAALSSSALPRPSPSHRFLPQPTPCTSYWTSCYYSQRTAVACCVPAPFYFTPWPPLACRVFSLLWRQMHLFRGDSNRSEQHSAFCSFKSMIAFEGVAAVRDRARVHEHLRITCHA